MKSILPRFNSQRMVMDYVTHYYTAARQQRLILTGSDYTRARELAVWRKKVAHAWPQVRLRRLDSPLPRLTADQTLSLRVAAHLDGLAADDVLLECLTGTESESGDMQVQDQHVFTAMERNEAGETVFALDLKPRLSGLQYYKIRMYPFHPALAHRLEAGYMIWL